MTVYQAEKRNMLAVSDVRRCEHVILWDQRCNLFISTCYTRSTLKCASHTISILSSCVSVCLVIEASKQSLGHGSSNTCSHNTIRATISGSELSKRTLNSGDVGLSDIAAGDLGSDRFCGSRVSCEQQHSRHWLVQAMTRRQLPEIRPAHSLICICYCHVAQMEMT